MIPIFTGQVKSCHKGPSPLADILKSTLWSGSGKLRYMHMHTHASACTHTYVAIHTQIHTRRCMLQNVTSVRVRSYHCSQLKSSPLPNTRKKPKIVRKMTALPASTRPQAPHLIWNARKWNNQSSSYKTGTGQLIICIR